MALHGFAASGFLFTVGKTAIGTLAIAAGIILGLIAIYFRQNVNQFRQPYHRAESCGIRRSASDGTAGAHDPMESVGICRAGVMFFSFPRRHVYPA